MSISNGKIAPTTTYSLIAIGAALLFLPLLGQVPLFDWDEINFAESAREMLLTGNWTRVTVDFQPFWEKPPFFIWLQALSMKVLGIGAYAARLPNALFGIATLVILFHIGKNLYNKTFGWLWVMAYVGSILPHMYFKSGIIDPVFNLFIFLGVYWLTLMTGPNAEEVDYKRKMSLIAGIFIGLAVLTKGPVGLLMPMLTGLGLLALYRFRFMFYWQHLGLFLLMTLIVSSAWYGLETIKNGFWFLQEFILYQIKLLTKEGAGHGGPWYYHFVVLLLGCFPASIFALGGLYHYGYLTSFQRHFKRVMILLLSAVLVVFSIVDTKIVHYSSLAYFPLTYLAADFIHHWMKSRQVHWRAYQTLLLGLIGVVLAVAFTALPLLGQHIGWLQERIQGTFAKANLNAEVHWANWQAVFGILYGLAILTSVGLLIGKRRTYRSVVVPFISTMLLVQVALYVFVPKIERYTQHAAVEFYQNLQGKDVYVEVLGFKSYAHFFYKRKQPRNAGKHITEDWLLEGPIDKPVYFVVKNHDLDSYYPDPDLELIKRKNGFVFLKRMPPHS